MIRSRTTAAVLFGLLVFYNTGSLLGLHAHRPEAGPPAVHAHAPDHSHSHSHSSAHSHAAPARPVAPPERSAGPALQAPVGDHSDFALLADFILQPWQSAALHSAVPVFWQAADYGRPALPVSSPPCGVRIRDGTPPPAREISSTGTNRAPPRLS